MLEMIGKVVFSEIKNHLEVFEEHENILLINLLFSGGQGDK